MKRILFAFCFLPFALSAALPTAPLAPTVSTNGVVLTPTNFWSTNAQYYLAELVARGVTPFTNTATVVDGETNGVVKTGSDWKLVKVIGGGGGITALTGDVTASGSGSVAATIANDAVTYAKMQNVSAASKILGRGDSGSGDVQEITIGSGLTMSGTTLSASGGGSQTPWTSDIDADGFGLSDFDELTSRNETVTASKPILNLAQTWNNSGVTFTGLKLNVVNTLSASASKLADLQIGGASKFSVDRSGDIFTAAGGGQGLHFTGLDNSRPAGVINEVGKVLSFGINVSQVGTEYTADKGGIFRIDTRPEQPYFSVIRRNASESTFVFDFQIDEGGRVIIEPASTAYATTPYSARLAVVDTSEQFRLGYDVDNYSSTTVDLDGNVAFDAMSASVSPVFTFNDPIVAKQFNGNSSTPSIAAGSGAGTSPTVSISGTDAAGEVTITTGTTPSVNAVIATITYSAAYPNDTSVVMWPANAATSVLAFLPFTDGTANDFTINAAVAVGLTSATTYKWNYVVIGR